jgi:hypothetical protein
MVDLVCDQCGNVFSIFKIVHKAYQRLGKERKFCSHKCHALSFITPKEILHCLQCGKSFSAPCHLVKSNIKRRGHKPRFCSKKCHGIHQRGKKWVDNSKNRWEGDDRGKHQSWRRNVVKRDNYTCKSCGLKHGTDENPLCAHHIVRWADSVELRYELDNGITLCKRCHYKAHGLKERKCQDTPTLQLVI